MVFGSGLRFKPPLRPTWPAAMTVRLDHGSPSGRVGLFPEPTTPRPRGPYRGSTAEREVVLEYVATLHTSAAVALRDIKLLVVALRGDLRQVCPTADNHFDAPATRAWDCQVIHDATPLRSLKTRGPRARTNNARALFRSQTRSRVSHPPRTTDTRVGIGRRKRPTGPTVRARARLPGGRLLRPRRRPPRPPSGDSLRRAQCATPADRRNRRCLRRRAGPGVGSTAWTRRVAARSNRTRRAARCTRRTPRVAPPASRCGVAQVPSATRHSVGPARTDAPPALSNATSGSAMMGSRAGSSPRGRSHGPASPRSLPGITR